MHKINFIGSAALATIILLFSACAKYTYPPGTASLTIIDAMATGDTLILTLNSPDTVSTSGGYFYFNFSNNGAKYQEYSAYTGTNTFHIHKMIVLEPVYPALFNTTLDLPVGSIQSLFLTGTTAKPDTLLVKDAPLQLSVADSSMGIRFVNLSPSSRPVSINMTGASSGSEIASLPYKSITGFKAYPTRASVAAYTFEFHDATTGDLLASCMIGNIGNPGTFTPNPYRNKNITIVFYDATDPVTGLPQSTFIVNNY